MTRYMARLRDFARSTRLWLAALLLLFSGAAFADDSNGLMVADGLLIYYSVIPAEMIRTYPKNSEESRMHGGIPDGRHIHHIQVALFDAKTNERITDAHATATISEPGLAGSTVELEPFSVQGAITYGNYFKFLNLVTYTIEIRVEHSGFAKVVEERFEYRHH